MKRTKSNKIQKQKLITRNVEEKKKRKKATVMRKKRRNEWGK